MLYVWNETMDAETYLADKQSHGSCTQKLDQHCDNRSEVAKSKNSRWSQLVIIYSGCERPKCGTKHGGYHIISIASPYLHIYSIYTDTNLP